MSDLHIQMPGETGGLGDGLHKIQENLRELQRILDNASPLIEPGDTDASERDESSSQAEG